MLATSNNEKSFCIERMVGGLNEIEPDFSAQNAPKVALPANAVNGNTMAADATPPTSIPSA
jgi:hypothetical protein